MANKVLLARLIGHSFADGNIHKNKQYFIYVNSNNDLQNEVKSIVNSLFGNVAMNIGTSISGTPRYQYSNKVGKYLVSKGAPKGSKVLQEIHIPEWIKNGKSDIKSAFLGAIFDDEGYFRDSPNCRQIVLKAAKTLHLKKNLEEYLEDLMSMLEAFDIKSSGIRKDQIKKNKDGTEMISLRFWITKKENFQKFRDCVDIRHPERKNKLNNMFSVPPSR